MCIRDSLAAYHPIASCPSRMAFSVIITVTAAHPAMRVRRALAKLSITSARLVSSSSGISAKGRAKLNTTCESTRIFSGSSPVAIIATAGMIAVSYTHLDVYKRQDWGVGF